MIKYEELAKRLSQSGVVYNLTLRTVEGRNWYKFKVDDSHEDIIEYIQVCGGKTNWRILLIEDYVEITYNILENTQAKVGKVLEDLLEKQDVRPSTCSTFKQEYTSYFQDNGFDYETIYIEPKEKEMNKEIKEHAVVHGTIFENPNEDIELAMSCIMEHTKNIEKLENKLYDVVDVVEEVPVFFESNIREQIAVEKNAIAFITQITQHE